jgi:hypothetical protein
MKFILLPASLALFLATSWLEPAQAAGCLKGAAVGGVAGHLAGHHGVLGAGAGCVIGHHEATKAAREKTQQQQSGSSGEASQPTSTSSGYHLTEDSRLQFRAARFSARLRDAQGDIDNGDAG